MSLLLGPKYPQRIEAFLTSDLEMHRTLTIAEDHQRRLDGSVIATRLLEEGASLAAALRAGGFIPDGFYLELDAVTKDTKLVISHWQCRDTPGYSPCRINHMGLVMVFGDAGCWSGPYGNWCAPTEIVSYLQRMKETAERVAERKCHSAPHEADRG